MVARITREELKARLDGNVPTLIVEALPPMYYEDVHLPGAININHDRIDALAPALLPDKNAEIVTYCANGPCPNSGIAAERLITIGYTNVREYYEGKQDWVEAGYPTVSGPHPHAPDTRERVRQLVDTVLQGRIMDAMREFYSDDVTMQENNLPPTVGKAANLEREEQFVGMVAEVKENRAASVLVDGDNAAIHWVAEYVTKDGQRLKFDQITHQTWKDGRIVRERFFYDPNALAPAG